MIKNLEIENFKSIKHAKLDCKRINVFIGEPNVGKSNLLEALSTFSAHYSESGKVLSEFIRFEKFSDLFYDHNLNNEVIINTNLGFVNVKYLYNIDLFEFITSSDHDILKVLKDSDSISVSFKKFQEFILYFMRHKFPQFYFEKIEI